MNLKNHPCDRCGKPSKVLLGYGPHYFCKKHFLEFFEKKIRKNLRLNKMVKAGEKILVALSGGKDSTAILCLLNKIFKNTNSITALIIDEGISGYREKAVKIASENCKKWKIPFKIVKFEEEFGISNDKIMDKIKENRKLGTSCAFCGTLRRKIMNKYARKLKADKIATGHNLDDEVQSIAMNFFDNDFKRFERLNTVLDSKNKMFVPRIKPLSETPEKEIILFCSFKKIKHYSEECCPFSWMAKRNDFRQMLNDFESKYPGTKYSILRFYQNIREKLKHGKKENGKINYCISCGEICSEEKCRTCSQLESLKSGNSKPKEFKKEKCKTLACNELKRLST